MIEYLEMQAQNDANAFNLYRISNTTELATRAYKSLTCRTRFVEQHDHSCPVNNEIRHNVATAGVGHKMGERNL